MTQHAVSMSQLNTKHKQDMSDLSLEEDETTMKEIPKLQSSIHSQ